MIVRFWEARVASGRLDDAVAHVRDALLVAAVAHEGYVSSEVFAADEVSDPVAGDQPARVVLLTRWTHEPRDLDESLPTDGSIARAHGWFFRAV